VNQTLVHGDCLSNSFGTIVWTFIVCKMKGLQATILTL
jgi:hypothetical protein